MSAVKHVGRTFTMYVKKCKHQSYVLKACLNTPRAALNLQRIDTVVSCEAKGVSCPALESVGGFNNLMANFI